MRLIDADALQALFNETIPSLLSMDGFQKDVECLMRAALLTIGMIKDAPTFDTVEAVHCKDCKYWGGSPREKEDGRLYASCRYHSYCNGYKTISWQSAEDDFCSRGKRKDK